MSLGGSMKDNKHSSPSKPAKTLASREGPRKSTVEETKLLAMNKGVPSYSNPQYAQQL
jgi:hypothetical protein